MKDSPYVAYMEIMKKLADEQKLFLTIASMEYIWGLNYQYCHGYIGKGSIVSQEKMRQAMGRIGRGNIQQTYSVRFRDDNETIFQQVFLPNPEKREAIRMNVLFNAFKVTYHQEKKIYLFEEETDEETA